ncbi:MAG: lipocalin family protein [Nitrospira sp.]
MICARITKRGLVLSRTLLVRGIFCAALALPGVPVGHVMGGEPPAKAVPAADLVGAWQLTMMIIDKNANNRLEDEERKDPIRGAQDYLKLNADGSCEFYTFKVKGRYEIKTSSSGYQTLVLFDKDKNKENRGRLYSVTKDELILIDHSSGSTFKVYKRL